MEPEVLTWAELVRRAGSERRARTLVERQEWWRVLRGAYAHCLQDDGTALRAAALRAVLPPGVALSHRAALWVLDLDVLRRGAPLDVTAERGRHVLPRRGLQPHIARLDDSELCDVDGVLVVSAARAVLDVARSEDLLEGVALADAVLRSGRASMPDPLEALERSAGLRGVRLAREVVRLADGRSESPQESRLRVIFVRGGVPTPVPQFDLYGPNGHVARTDLWVEGVANEFDGLAVHTDPRTFAQDRWRQTRIVELGVEVRRYSGLDVYRRPTQTSAPTRCGPCARRPPATDRPCAPAPPRCALPCTGRGPPAQTSAPPPDT